MCAHIPVPHPRCPPLTALSNRDAFLTQPS